MRIIWLSLVFLAAVLIVLHQAKHANAHEPTLCGFGSRSLVLLKASRRRTIRLVASLRNSQFQIAEFSDRESIFVSARRNALLLVPTKTGRRSMPAAFSGE
jgi:hypothetical protein